MTRRWALVVALLLTGCGGGPPVVGVLLPLSGVGAERGRQALAAIELAAEQAGADWTLDVRDTASRPAQALAQFQALAKAGVSVVLGPLHTDEAAAAASLARAWKLPLLSPAALGPVADEEDPWAFRMAFRDGDAARGLAAYARYTLELDRVVLVTDLSRSDAVSLAAAFADEWQRRRGVIAGELAYHGGDGDRGDLAGLLDRAAALEADAVFVPGLAADVRAMVQAADDATLSELVLLGGDGWESGELCAALAGRVSAAYSLGHFAADESDPAAAAFVRLYREATGETPGDGAALGWDAAGILLELAEPGLSPADWQRRLLSLRRHEGVTGSISLDPRGAATRKPVRLLQCLDGGRPRFVERLSG